MNKVVDNILKMAMRKSRDDALQTAIELCQMIIADGGCATCCAREIQSLRNEMQASDAVADLLDKVKP